MTPSLFPLLCCCVGAGAVGRIGLCGVRDAVGGMGMYSGGWVFNPLFVTTVMMVDNTSSWSEVPLAIDISERVSVMKKKSVPDCSLRPLVLRSSF